VQKFNAIFSEILRVKKGLTMSFLLCQVYFYFLVFIDFFSIAFNTLRLKKFLRKILLKSNERKIKCNIEKKKE